MSQGVRLRRADEPPTWPTPTHGAGRERPWRTAADCIDWTIECPSIFERAKALAEKTLARIRAGIERFVFGSARPFIVRTAMHMSNSSCAQSPDEPLKTITTDGGMGVVSPMLAIATPYLVHRSNGERGATETTKAQAPRVYDATKPLGTLMAQGQKHALAMPVLEAPLDAISAGNMHHALTVAYLLRYNGTSVGQPADRPLSTLDTRDRFAVVTLEMEREVSERAMRVSAFLGYDAPIVLEIDGVQWVLVDIGFRMLVARELFLCQGFPPSWIIDLEFHGKPLTKTAQIKCCGNSVPPQLAKAVAMAAIRTIRYEPEMRRAA